MISVSIVTTCKGRLAYLKKALPSWLAQDVGPHITFEIIVVDFGCPDGVADWCESLSEPRVRVVRAVNNVDVFNLSRARNIGASTSAAEFMAFVDADIQLRHDFIRRCIGTSLGQHVDVCVAGLPGNNDSRFTSSLCTVERATFEKLRGFDESIQDYGEDDSDFYRRCDCSRVARHWMEWDADHHSCTDDERTRFYLVKDIYETMARNEEQTKDPRREVNANGWGRP